MALVGLLVCGREVVRVLRHVRRQMEHAVAVARERECCYDSRRVERAVDVGVVDPIGRFQECLGIQQLLADAQEHQALHATVVAVCDVRDLFQCRTMDEAVAFEAFGDVRS